MPNPKSTRIFLASPGDMIVERETMPGVIDSINRDVGDLLNVRLDLVRWETHAAPAAGRPQAVVFDDVGNYDVFIGLMWRRFGTPSKDGDSGTVEEYRDAYSRWERDSSFPLFFYFCEQPFFSSSLDEADQFRKVLEFRKEIERTQLLWTFPSHDGFPELVRGHLIQRLKGLKSRPQTKMAPHESTMAVLRELWPDLASDARDALASAFNMSRTLGDGGIKTESLFESFDAFAKGQSRKIIDLVPDAAMPPQLPGALDPTPYILSEKAWFSPCVTDSLTVLSKKAKPDRPLTGADLFVDLAKHGKGGSVRRLRNNNIGPVEIDGFVRDTGASVVMREDLE